MSIRSKAKRDSGRKKSVRAAKPEPPSRTIEPHAELRDRNGNLLGGIARQDDEWVLGLDGKIVGGSASPATILAILKRAAAMQERAGNNIELKFSAALRKAADEEAQSKGLSFEEFEAQLDQTIDQTAMPAPGSPRNSSAVH